MTIHSPCLHDAIGIPVFARTPNVIDNAIGSAQFALAHFLRDFDQGLLPTNAFPFAFTAFANSLQWIQNALRIINLIVRRGSLGAVSSPAARVNRITFELAD